MPPTTAPPPGQGTLTGFFRAPAAAPAAAPPAVAPSPPATVPTGTGPREKKAKYGRAPGQPMCSFGKGCYRKNPVHFQEQDHPDDHPLIVEATAAAAAGAPPPPATAAAAAASATATATATTTPLSLIHI